MAASSGSPATSDEMYLNFVRIRNYLPRRPNYCEDGRALVWVSRTLQNPGRRFYCCKQNLCAHWDWINEELTDHYRGIMNEYRSERDVAQEQLRNAELREQLNSEQLEALRKECNESQTRICELKRSIEDLDCCIADLQGNIDSLEITVASHKNKIRVLKKAIFILLIFICCVIFMK